MPDIHGLARIFLPYPLPYTAALNIAVPDNAGLSCKRNNMHSTIKKPSLRWLAFTCVCLFFLFEFVVRIEPSLAASDIAHFLGLSNTEFGVLASLFFWVYAPMQLVVGLALDRFGVRRTLVPAVLLCALGAALFAASNQLALTAVGRLLTGFGASFAFVGALYVVNHQFAPERFAVLSGIVNAMGMLGAAVGAVALSGLIEVNGWRPVFLLTGAAGAGLFVLAFLFLHGVRTNESRNSHLLAPLRTVFSSRRIWLIAVVGSLFYMPVNVFAGLWGQQEMIKDHTLSPVQAETAVSMIYWGMAAGSVLSGIVSDWLGHRKWLVVVTALLAALTYSLAIYGPTTSVLQSAALLFMGGLFGGGQMLTFAMAKEGEPTEVSGSVIAFVNMVGIGSALIFQPLLGYLVDLEHGSFAIAASTIPLCLLASALLALLVREQRHPDHISATRATT